MRLSKWQLVVCISNDVICSPVDEYWNRIYLFHKFYDSPCRLVQRGISSEPVLVAYGNILVTQKEADLLYALLHKHRNLPNTAILSFLQGLHAFLRSDYFQALEHLNLCLVLKPSMNAAWVAIGKVRSAMVC